ncbi:MAG: Bug family tripartite tricarboxylate transporter substrate binding protein [Burkholderiales bacterium]
MRISKQNHLIALVAVTLFSFTNPTANAADWPAKPLSMVVPYTPGSLTDIIVRVITPKLAVHLGQPVLIDYRPGQATAIGSRFVAKGQQDGYTMIMQGASTVAVANMLNPEAGYSIEDFDSVSIVGLSPLALVVRTNLPARNVNELIAMAKAKPGSLTYAAAGNGGVGHLATTLFSSMAGLNQQSLLMIPYKGSGDAVVDLIGGRVDMQISVLAPTLGAIKSGQLRILGVASPARQAVLPDVPTIMEAGVPNYEVVSSLGILVRRGTPQGNITTLNQAFNKVLVDPEIKSQLANRGIAAAEVNPPQAFGNEIRKEAGKYGPVIREYGIKAE